MSDDTKKELKVPVEVYSRVVGYFRPVNQWNKGKQEEFRERKTYDVSQFMKDTINYRDLKN